MPQRPPSPNTTPAQQNDATPTTVTDVDDPRHPLHHHRRTVTDFDYGQLLGEGSYSLVLEALDKKTDKRYAIKKLDKAHIVKNDKVKYVMVERDALNYVLDLASHGELYTFIRQAAPFDIETARYYASEILLAVDHIHSKQVIHSILLDDQMHIKIVDFGSAKILSEDISSNQDSNMIYLTLGTRSFVGTAEYIAPELLRSDATTKEADWWAFGCILFQMLTGKSPFKAATEYLVFQKIKHLEYEFPADLSPVACDLIKQLLVPDPENRLGSDALGGVDSIKSHSFFDGVDFDQVFSQPAPAMAQQYKVDWERQQEERKNNHSSSDEDDPFDTWWHGNTGKQHVDDRNIQH
ncbi:kinase-like domain-containing protein [Absidia repens]|uniref:non-specific serine/threonine protein kinase n=1 Tax=Absidia repens TaxID=90262 RepID=A0A1X2IG03_9FUNG|nr:kinase-like domain-containing protein [Absidia repens]